MKKIWAIILGLFGCVPKFVDTTSVGVPNLVEFAPRMWRLGQAPTPAAWQELAARVAPGKSFYRGRDAVAEVVVVKLNDDEEGSDDYASSVLGWGVVKIPLPPEDDKPWTVLEVPSPADVQRAVTTILDAHAAGKVVLWHCSHGRDRTGLVSALVGMKLFGWSKSRAWDDMLEHGFRWELPDLDLYWLEDVSDAPGTD